MTATYPLAAVAAAGYNSNVNRGDDVMKWLTAVFILLLLALAAVPAAFDAASRWVSHRRASVQAIDYLSRDINELSASRRRSPPQRNPRHGVTDQSSNAQSRGEPMP
jgi:hypothetical protein